MVLLTAAPISKVVRLGIGRPTGARSSVFRVWASPRGDVYVAARNIAGDMKTSLHSSGRWRVAFTEAHAAKPGALVPKGKDRAVHKWARPEEFAPRPYLRVGRCVSVGRTRGVRPAVRLQEPGGLARSAR